MLNLLWKLNKQGVLSTLSIASLLVASEVWAIDFESVYKANLNSNYELGILRSNAEAIRLGVQSLKGSYFPSMGLESRYEIFSSEFEKLQGNSSHLYLEWRLFSGFQDAMDIKALELEWAAIDSKKQRLEMNLKWEVLASYSKAHAKQVQVKAYGNAISDISRILSAAKRRKASGRLTEADFLEFQVLLAKLERELMDYETQQLEAIKELESISGQVIGGPLVAHMEPKELRLNDLDFSEVFSSSKKSRLQESRLRLLAAEAQKRKAEGGFWPEVNLKLTHGNLGLREASHPTESFVGVTARWELFSGLSTLNQQRSAAATLSAARVELSRDNTYALNRATYLKAHIKSLLVRLKNKEYYQQSTVRLLKATEDEYRRGVKSSGDLVSALELNLDAKIDYANLRADYFKSRAELQDILGIEIEELE